MARCLIIEGGPRAVALTRALRERGHAVRATTREPAELVALGDAGAEALPGDPDRVATLVPALEHVSAAYILLGSASGPADALAALHSTRLDMLLSKMLDSTVRGIVYEAAGSVPAALLGDGAARVRAFCEDSRLPYALLRANGDEAWLGDALAAGERVLAGA